MTVFFHSLSFILLSLHVLNVASAAHMFKFFLGLNIVFVKKSLLLIQSRIKGYQCFPCVECVSGCHSSVLVFGFPFSYFKNF